MYICDSEPCVLCACINIAMYAYIAGYMYIDALYNFVQ